MATRESSKKTTPNKGVRANGSRSKCGKKKTAVGNKRDGGAPKDSLGDEKEVEQKLELEHGVSSPVITSDDETCTSDIVPAANNLTDMDENIQKAMGVSKYKHGKGAAKSRKNSDGQGQIDNMVEKEVEKLIESEDVQKENGIPLDGPSSENFGNGEDIQKLKQGSKCENGTDDHNKKSLDEIIEEGKYLGDKGDNREDNLVNQGIKSPSENLTIDAGAKSEHMTGNASGETERVSDAACGEQVTNRDDMNLGPGNCERAPLEAVEEEAEESKDVPLQRDDNRDDVVNQGIKSPSENLTIDAGGKSEHMTGNASGETERVSDAACGEQVTNRDDMNLGPGNCERAPLEAVEEEAKECKDVPLQRDDNHDDLVNQGIKSESENLTIDAGAKSEHMTGNASGETERVSDDACGEQVTNRDDMNLGPGNCERAPLEAVEEEDEECKDVPLQRDDNGDDLVNQVKSI